MKTLETTSDDVTIASEMTVTSRSLEEILENRELNFWIKNFGRAPYQINMPHEADAELIEVQGNELYLLAMTIDSVSEEIITGLYQQPFTMGWVTVMSNFSDLAAVGASPLGIVTAISVEPNRSKAFCQGIAQGMAAACSKLGTFILGGDTNSTQRISLTGCAIGLVPREEKITRIGCQPGDSVFLSGFAGNGSALGLVRFAKLSDEYFPEKFYRPLARIKEGQILRKYASCCMDTSDGVLATLDQLMRLNGKGFEIDSEYEKFIHPAALKLSRMMNLPDWIMLAGHHGEFELLFTIPPLDVAAFLADAHARGWNPIKLGQVIEQPGIQLSINGRLKELDTGMIRNLFVEMNGNIEGYVKEIIKLQYI